MAQAGGVVGVPDRIGVEVTGQNRRVLCEQFPIQSDRAHHSLNIRVGLAALGPNGDKQEVSWPRYFDWNCVPWNPGGSGKGANSIRPVGEDSYALPRVVSKP